MARNIGLRFCRSTIAPFLGLPFFLLLITNQPSPAAIQTNIDGVFNGCEYDKMYKLTNGHILVCHGYSYHYAYRPEVIILGNGTAIIDNDKYDATMAAGSVVETRVDGDFEGCDFDKIILFSNGLAFQCRTYKYHYSYSPEVKIFITNSGQQVFIDNEKYDGTVYRQ